MLCPKCTREIPDDAVLCCYCGRRLTAAGGAPKRRGNGQGTAFRRGRTWSAQVVVGYRLPDDPAKKPISIKRTKGGFRTKAEALAACPLLLSGGIERPQQAPRLSWYWDAYTRAEYQQLSKSKQTAYRIAWGKLSRIHDARIDTLTASILRDTVAEAAPTYYTAKDCKTVLTILFNLAAADRYADKDTPSFITLPQLQEKERQPFTVEEQTALWRLYESGDIRAAIPLLMIYTGMMPGEAQALKVEHIDLQAHTITGVGMKTAVRRSAPIVLPEAILPLVGDLIDRAQASGYIWCHNTDVFYADYYAALEAAGCRRLTPYSCRHTTATALAITEGIAPQTVRKYMRWSTTKMLDRYAHPQTSDVQEAASALKRPV